MSMPHRLLEVPDLGGGWVILTIQRCQLVTTDRCHSMFVQLRREHLRPIVSPWVRTSWIAAPSRNSIS
ncbi:MAG TPA: hypothetical protein VMO88_01630 [Acidimicrobiales bacterium]|nr:hypothetical protein [Acidimicrobiales bacterium]